MGVFCETLSLARTSKVDKQLDALAARFTPRIKKAFLASVADIKDKAVITAITDAIAVGDLEAAFRATGLSAAAMRPITQMIETAFEQGGVTVANSAPRGITDGFGNRAVFRFDVRNSRSEAWLRDHSSSLVTRITDDTRDNIRTIIQRGVAEGRNPRNIALDIVGRVNPDNGRRTGGIIGLTAPQERWVGNARRDLTNLDPHYFTRVQRDKRFDSIVRKAIDTGTPLSGAKIDALVDKYSDNLLLQRGETIARTEAMQSLNKAADDAFRQAIDEGTLKPNAVTKAWDSAGDNRVRESHKAMDGQTVQMDEPFKSPDGAQLMFPGDTSLGAPASEIIDCRCRVRHAVDWFADLDDDDEAPPAPAPRPVPPVPPAPTPTPPIPRITDVLDALPEDRTARNARLDTEQRDYVLENGRTNGVEFLSNYDMETGEILGRADGEKSFVGFPPDLLLAISDVTRQISLHHNHPKSSSFSGQDLFMLNEYEGMREIWAHGHNGSSYFARRLTPAAKTTEEKMKLRLEYDNTNKNLTRHITDYSRSNNIKTDQAFEDDLNLYYAHVVSMIMQKKGFIEYKAELQGPSAVAFEKHKTMIEFIVSNEK